MRKASLDKGDWIATSPMATRNDGLGVNCHVAEAIRNDAVGELPRE
ncbi:MAG: hypothetical protein PHW66_01540 [Gallionella sp.]|nr:hypothetical protein [Gallionella sp.]